MSEQGQTQSSYIDVGSLPRQFPTHRHDPEFWEALGRTIATFGFLEEILTKAIFMFIAARQYPESEIEAAYLCWLPTLEGALKDPLGKLISEYEKAARENPDANIDDLDELIGDLRNSSLYRNALCHGSWPEPDEEGKSIPFFVDRHMMKFDTPIDISLLQKIQQHVAELACAVMNSVTQMGWQFPGSNGPGKSIMA